MADDRDLKKDGKASRIRLLLKDGVELPHDLDNLVQYLHYRGVIPDPFAIEILQKNLHYRDVIPHPFAAEKMKKMGQDLCQRLLQILSPEYLGLDDVTVGEFYSKARSKKFQMCSVINACRFAIEDGQELGKETIHVGMIPTMCSDNIKRILMFKNDEYGVLHMEGFECLEQIWLGDKFLFCVI